MPNLLKEKLDKQIVIFDGAIGTELYKRDFFVNTSYEGLVLTNPDQIKEIHQGYVDAGADVLTTNTYGANRNKLRRFGLADKVFEINQAAVELARQCCGEQNIVGGSVGQIGESSYGHPLSDKIAQEIIQEQIGALDKAGVDFIILESLSTEQSVIDALVAISAFPNLAYMISLTGAHEHNPAENFWANIMSKIQKNPHQPTAVGLNCGTGAEGMLTALESLLPLCPYPIIVQPNAGMPKSVDNRMIYMCSPEYLTTYAVRYVNLGAHGVGGCCGTGPEHIRDIARSIRPLSKNLVSPRIEVIEAEIPLLEAVPLAQRSKLGAKLAGGEWITTVEVTPPRGYDLQLIIEKAIQCREAGIDAMNIPDGPRASSRISPLVMAIEIQEKAGLETILHFCCRDKNLIGMQAELLGCACKKINNILFITGDPPKLGDYPFASAVFDVDSIGILKVQSRLNQGVDIGGKPIGQPTSFCGGAGADPNSLDMDRELRRLREKVDAGAEFIITQPVFSAEPLLKMLEKMADLKVPVIAGIWPLASYRNAEFMKNEVPGVVVPDEVMARMARADNKEEQRFAGIEIARENIAKIRDAIQGVQVSAPFGNVNTALEVLK
ncbi:MAG: bifunctional homocysteine S-methyltransferase/methylenetetrahydrofolate reductase [Victivallaceae bacterium]|nr:bifunctional homocysteine S-methyltransferase/methylenetetrahydrofolate reductase [Victivallaceae bacterium]